VASFDVDVELLVYTFRELIVKCDQYISWRVVAQRETATWCKVAKCVPLDTT
jgi:hypothetical protein